MTKETKQSLRDDLSTLEDDLALAKIGAEQDNDDLECRIDALEAGLRDVVEAHNQVVAFLRSRFNY